MRGVSFLVLILAVLAVPKSSLAVILYGEVVGISDGDTITVLDADRKTHKIRLAGIDTPESRQPYGLRAKESLSDLTYRKSAQIEWSKADRYGRIVGKVIVGGQDVCLEQIRQGMAWHFKRYENEQPLEDRLAYAKAEEAARAAKNGLWSDPNPIPPWNWRKAIRP
jgi:endonuclease YncB( thermonuclease family)